MRASPFAAAGSPMDWEAYVPPAALLAEVEAENKRGLGSCCEYTASDGRVRSVLQFCCECDAVDDSMSEIVQGKLPPMHTIHESFVTISDRCRIPWPNGAVRVDIGFVCLPIYFFGLILLSSMAGKSSWIIPSCLAIGSHLLMFGGVFIVSSDLRLAGTRFFMWYTAYGTLAVLFFSYYYYGAAPLFPSILLIFTAVAMLLQKPIVPPALRDLQAPAPDKDSLVAFYRAHAKHRAKYCRISDLCVPRFDHYCIWLARPVAAHNHLFFLGFTLALSLTGFIVCVKLPFWGVSAFVSTFALTAAVAVSMLFASQVYQILRNYTAYERIYWHSLFPNGVNPNDKGWVNNLKEFLNFCTSNYEGRDD